MRGLTLGTLTVVLMLHSRSFAGDAPPATAGQPTVADANAYLLAPQFTDTKPCECAKESWLDNFSLFGGLEASRQPQDLGVNANLGAALSANIGLPLIPAWGVGVQIGTGVNLSRAGVKVLHVVEGTNDREQWFSTLGVFKRSERWYAGVGYDLEVSSYYNSITAGQVRGEVGYQVGGCNTIGLWGAVATNGDNVNILNIDYVVRPISQISFFWNHRWETGADIRIWAGIAGQHGTDIVLLPDDHRTDPQPVFGLQVFVPLNEHFALFGQGNFVTPNDTGTMDAYLGLAYFWGGAARSRTNMYAPVLPVANNPTLPLDLRRP